MFTSKEKNIGFWYEKIETGHEFSDEKNFPQGKKAQYYVAIDSVSVDFVSNGIHKTIDEQIVEFAFITSKVSKLKLWISYQLGKVKFLVTHPFVFSYYLPFILVAVLIFLKIL